MFNLILQEQDGIQIIAGKTASGKSKLCKILAEYYNYFYVDYDENPSFQGISGCGQWWIDRVKEQNYKGLIFDCPKSILKQLVTDWDEFSWSIPIMITEQLNRNAIVNIGSIQNSAKTLTEQNAG